MQTFKTFLKLISSYQIKTAVLKLVKHGSINQFHLVISRDFITWKLRAEVAEVHATQNPNTRLQNPAV